MTTTPARWTRFATRLRRRLLPLAAAAALATAAAPPAQAAYWTTTLPGGVADAPSVVTLTLPGQQWRVAVMARGYDNALWAQFGNGTSWYGWQKVGGSLRGAPACTELIGNIYCVARWADNTTRLIGWNRTSQQWSFWRNLGGISHNSPSLSQFSDNVTGVWGLKVYQRGTDGKLYFLHMPHLEPSTPYWIRVGNVPTATSPGCGSFVGSSYCFVMPSFASTLHVVRNNYSDGSNVQSWNVGGVSSERPSFAAIDDISEKGRLFVRGLDGYLWSRGYKLPGLPSWAGPDNWGPWHRHALRVDSAPSCDWRSATTKEFWCAQRTAAGPVQVIRWIPSSIHPLVE